MLGSPSHGYLSINPIIFPLSKLITLWSQPTDIFNIFQDWRLCLVPPITNLTQHFDWHLISSQNSQETETIINFQLWFKKSAWLGGPSSINWAITYLPWQGLSHRKCCLVPVRNKDTFIFITALILLGLGWISHRQIIFVQSTKNSRDWSAQIYQSHTGNSFCYHNQKLQI